MNQKQKELIKIFLFLFFFSFVLINWNSVGWIFNYRAVSGLVSDFFTPYPDTALALTQMNKSAPHNTTAQILSGYSTKANSLEISGVNKNNSPQLLGLEKQPSLEIPKISISTPVIVSDTTNKATLAKYLDQGAVYYPGSVLPGEDGQMVILGHSAPPNWPHIKHDYIFSDLQNLVTGDQIILNFNNQKYTYKVTDSKIIQRGGDVPTPKVSGNVLTLISCWPPGKDYQRIAVTAELIEI